MDSDLSLEFLRVVEQAAIACAHTMGQGDRHNSDQAAVEAMRRVMDTVPIDGTIVIGEGERDEAPMLFIGEKVGLVHALDMVGPRPVRYDEVDIAVDPLEGTNLCATGAPNAIAVLAASERGGLLHAPDLYMEKLVVGPSSKHAVHLDATVAENLNAVAKCLGRKVKDLVVIVLDRPRHEKLIADIRATGARIQLIGDGDLSAGIAAALVGTGVHAVMGTGGAPEGVLCAAAIPAERSPSPMRRIRAPVARISAMSFSCRGRSSTITTRSLTLRPRHFAMALRFSATVASRCTACFELGPTTSFSMYRSGAWSRPPRSDAASTAIAFGAPVAHRFVPSSGSTAISTSS